MNILMLNWRDIRNPDAGGAEIHSREIGSRWASWGNEVTLLCSGFQNAQREEKLDGVRIVRLGNRYTVYGKVVRYLLRHDLMKEYDVIYESINTVPFFSPIFSAIPAVAQIYSIDNWLALLAEAKFSAFPATLVAFAATNSIRSVYRGCEIVTISQFSRNRLVGAGFDGGRIRVAHPGVSDEWRELIANATGPERPNSTIVYVGRLKKYKGVQDVLRAIPLIRQRISNIRFVIIGRGDYEPALRNLVTSFGIEENVVFCGYVSEEQKAAALMSSSLYVCTSVDEGGWTISAVEAMSAGVPVLVTSSQSDVTNNSKTGIVLRSKDPQAIASEACSILSDMGTWERLSNHARQFSSSFTWDKTAEMTLDALQRASGSNQP